MNNNKKSKVLFVLPNDKLGGAEQHLKNIASHLISNNFVADVYFLKKETSFQWRGMGENINLFFTKKNKESLGVISFLIMLLQRNSKNRKYDYIFTSHVHVNSLVGILIFLGILKKKFFIGRESTSIFRRFKGIKLLMFKAFYKLGYFKLDLLICQTNYMKAQLEEALPKLASLINIEVIPNPINLNSINIEDDDFDLFNQNYIVSAGRLIPEKGYDVLIKAFATLTNKFSDLKLVILGEGEQRARLGKLIKDLHLNDKVILLGFKKNVYSYFNSAKVCVVSSRIEGFPNVLLQMMSQNTTVVCTLCAGGISEIPLIYTCEPDNVGELASVIQLSLMEDNIDKRPMFDNYLHKRSVTAFINKVNHYLGVTT